MEMMRSAELLLVEDSLADVRLTEEALKENKLKVNLHVVNDGLQAMEFLRKQGKYANAPTPDLILLDLNMPRMDGREVLKTIKEDTILSIIPVIVLTISDAEQDISFCYQHHVNCYIKKPLDLKKFIDVVAAIESFWLTVVTLPSKI